MTNQQGAPEALVMAARAVVEADDKQALNQNLIERLRAALVEAQQPAHTPKPAPATQQAEEVEFDGYKGHENVRWYINNLQRIGIVNQWFADGYCNKLREFFTSEHRRNGQKERDAERMAANDLRALASKVRNLADEFWSPGENMPEQFVGIHDTVTERLLSVLTPQPSPTPQADSQPAPSAAAASKAVLAAIRAANMQLVRTGDDEFMLVTFKQATPQADSAPATSDLITIRKPTTRAEVEWLVKLAHLLVGDVNEQLQRVLDGAEAPQADSQPAPVQDSLLNIVINHEARVTPAEVRSMAAELATYRAARAPADSVTAPAGGDVVVPTWKPLRYATPRDLWKAFKGGAKFVLHYHGKAYPVERMQARETVVYVQPPGMPVKLYPDGQNCESAGDAIWLEELATPPAQAADSVLEDAAFEAVRKKLCALPRYSFVLDDDGLVRRVQGRAGNWIEFDDAHELFDPVAIDAAASKEQTMTEPTDADLRALLPMKLLERDMPPKVQVWLTQKDAFAFARAVLAKWGQPSGAVDWIGASSHHLIQQPTQAVPPAGREPLTDGQAKQSLWAEHLRWMQAAGLDTEGMQPTGEWLDHWLTYVRAIERAHGIKGGQHG